MKSRYLEIVLISFLLLVAPTSVAATGSEAVTNFSQTASLSRAGQLTVDQKIDYNYGTSAPHNLTLSIPVNYHDDQGREYRLEFRLLSASVNGAAVQAIQNLTPAVARITLPVDSAQKTPASITHFALRYSLAPTVIRADQGDAFRLVATGLAWSVPINHLSLDFQAPTTIANLVCSTGTATTNTSNCESTQAGSTAIIVTDAPLEPGDTLSIFASFAPHSFTTYMQPYAQPGSWLGLGIGLGMVVLVLIVVVLLARRLSLRRPIVHSRPAEYTKPNDSAQT